MFLPKRLRRHVAIFYAFARAADDIADSPNLPSCEKIYRLESFQNALLGNTDIDRDAACPKALNMAKSLKETGVSPQHCLDILAAFRQDAVKSRYDDWPELIAYCRLSAAPVGRYLIDLHGGSRLGYWPSDALCAALQLINHVQDCGDDYMTLGRVYLPSDWMADACADFADLEATQASPAVRRVLDWMTDGIDTLLLDAGALSANLYSRRLGYEASVIFQIAKALNNQLKKHDPLLRRIELSKHALLICSIRGILCR